MVGGSTVLATNETLVRNDPDGSSTTLATTSQGFKPGAVVRDGTAYVRVDDALQAIDVGDGSVLWQAPSGPSVLGGQPSVSDDAVVFSMQDGGLVSVDRATGRPRWVAPLDDAVSVVPALQLPDGDVIYGGASLARYDGASGDVVWQQQGTYLFGPGVATGGLVVAPVFAGGEGSGIAAYDAGTGDQVCGCRRPPRCPATSDQRQRTAW